MATIAQRILNYYDSEDFKSNYISCMLEARNEWNERVKKITKEQFELNLTDEQIEKVCEAIYENVDDYISDYSNYYVGHCCVDAVSFGEQEEDLSSITNNRTGRDYTKNYLIKSFDKAGFVVNKSEYGVLAYYDMSGEGLRITITEEQVRAILNL